MNRTYCTFFCEGCTWHNLYILVKEPLCCDWKGRAASSTLWHQATINIPCRAHLISACSRHMSLVLHTHPVRGEPQIHQNQCCHCCFFSLDLVFFCCIWGSNVFIENLFFLLWSSFRNVCCVTVFSIREYCWLVVSHA